MKALLTVLLLSLSSMALADVVIQKEIEVPIIVDESTKTYTYSPDVVYYYETNKVKHKCYTTQKTDVVGGVVLKGEKELWCY